jgi:glycosyltransferase involved in cell wall biosynthesis
MPAVIGSFDVGLIPFRLGPEGLHASPIKLYEYLASGLPVLSTPIPEAQEMAEVSIASDARGFASLLDRAHQMRGSASFRERAIARARDHDWSRRASTALEALGLAPVNVPVA